MKALSGGVEMAVTGVETGYVLRCPGECDRVSGCPLRRLSLRAGGAGAPLTLVTVVVFNGSQERFSMDVGAWELVDAQGFAMGGAAVCEMLLPASYVPAGRWAVSPGTRVRTALAFPALPSGESIATLLYADGGRKLRMEMRLTEGKSASSLPRMRIGPPEGAQARGPLRLTDGRKVKRLYGERVRWQREKKKRGIRVEECYSVRNPDGEQLFLAIGRKKKKKR